MNKITLVSFCLIAFCIQAFSQLKINEVSANKGIITEYGEESDWLELINYTGAAIDIEGYFLSDDADNPMKWEIPSDMLNPLEIYPIFASGNNEQKRVKHWESVVKAENEWKYTVPTQEMPGWRSMSFDDSSWDSGPGGIGYGDADDGTSIETSVSVYLRHTFNLNSIDNIKLLAFHADYDDAYVAYLNGVEIARSWNISGAIPAYNAEANDPHEAELYQGGAAEQLVLSHDQLLALLVPGDNLLAVSVHNDSEFSSDLTGNFFLSPGITDESNDYQSLPTWFDLPSNFYHTNFKISSGETIFLADPTGTIIDEVTLDPGLDDGLSQGRSPDGTDTWCVFGEPTPGSTNNLSWCYDGVEPIPSLSLESGYYDGAQFVMATPGSATQVVRYTLNGDYPTIGASTFDDPLTYDESGILSVRAYSTGNLLPSPVIDRTYVIDQQNFNLPMFSVHTDDANLWDWNNGIYVDGPNAGNDYPYFGANFWEPWSKWSRLEYFDTNQIKQGDAEFDLEIHGGWSRAEPQKSFRFDFKSEYTGRFDHAIMPDKPYIQSFNNLNVRNGGQHVWGSKIQDAFIGRLVAETDVDNMGWQPFLVFLNGDYWGIYGAREKHDEHYVEDNHGVPSESVDLMNSYALLAGSQDHWEETISAIMGTNANSADFYAEFDSRMDLENYIDYFAIETYIANTDWMGIAWGANNIKLWHPQVEGGKWRYMLYDTDGGMGYFGAQVWDNYLNFARNPAVESAHSELFDHVLDNPQFMHQFVNRYADLMNTIFEPTQFNAKLQETHDFISDAMPDHIDRWGAPSSVNQWNNAVNTISLFNSGRLGYARSHVNSEFDLEGERDVYLDVSPAGAGRIQISTISPDEYPWEGVYFDGCPVQITAIPNPGYTFDHWEANNIWASNNNNQTEVVDLDEDDDFIAVFSGSSESIELTVSEICYNPSATIPSGEWLELHNAGDYDLDLSLYKVFDQYDQFEFTLPMGTIIPQNGYVVLAGNIAQFSAAYPSVNNVISESQFTLGNDGDIINVVGPSGNYVISMVYNDNPAWPQGADGIGRTLEYFGTGSQDLATNWFDGCIGGSPGEAYSPCVEPIVFSEVNYHSLSTLESGDWVELWNVLDQVVDLSGWQVRNGQNSGSYTFGDDVLLAPDGRIVVCEDLAAFEAVYACHVLDLYVGPAGFSLDNGGETIELLTPNGTLSNVMAYDDDELWPSEADGLGSTLELTDAAAPLAHPDSWIAGCPQGSPTQPYDADCLQGMNVAISAVGNVLSANADGGTLEYTFTWTVNGIEVGTGTSITTIIDGDYVVTVTDDNGCSVSSEPFTFNWVGIVEAEISSLEMYPNPATNQVWIMSPEMGTVKIYAIDGSLIQELNKSFGPMDLSVSHLSAGYYVVALQTNTDLSSGILMVH